MDICQQKVHDDAMTWLQNSGKFIEQLGLTEECMALKNTVYYLVTFMNNNTKLDSGAFIGLCLPEECTVQTVTIAINKQLANMTLPIPLAVEDVHVNPQYDQFDKIWLFYLVLILLITFTGLAVAASFIKTKWRAFQAFSFVETSKIFVYKPNYLNVFNGIKTICMLWVIFGHQFSVRLKNDVNIYSVGDQVTKFFYLFVLGAFLAVDVFFFIGGFLVAYSFMREKSKSLLKYPMAILHRLLRFWPSYLMTIAIYYSVYIHTNDGPLWWQNMTLGEISYCGQSWKTVLFLDNLVYNGEKMCLGWGWYLQNDMQIFVFSMLYIYLYTRNRKAGYIALSVTILISLSLNIYEAQVNEYVQVTHLIDFRKWSRYFPDVYIKPWTRCPPYLMGLIFGLLHMQFLAAEKEQNQRIKAAASVISTDRINQGDGTSIVEDQTSYAKQQITNNFLLNLKGRLKKSKIMVYGFQMVGIALMLFTVMIPHPLQLGDTWPQAMHSLYLSCSKVTFTLGVYIMILPSLLSVPNMTFFLMDTKFFNFTSKISFWTYLIHYMIVETVSFSQKVDFYYTLGTILPLYFSIAVMSLFFGLVGTVLVEAPFAKLEKLLFEVILKGKKKDFNQSTMVEAKESLLSNQNSSLLGNKKESLLSSKNDSEGINRSIRQ